MRYAATKDIRIHSWPALNAALGSLPDQKHASHRSTLSRVRQRYRVPITFCSHPSQMTSGCGRGAGAAAAAAALMLLCGGEAGADAGAEGLCSSDASVAASPIIASHVSSVDVVGAAVLKSGGTVACSVPLAA